MASKEDKPKPEKDSAKTDPAPKKSNPSVKESEIIPPEESFPSALAPSVKPKKENQSSSLWGILFFFFLILAGGIGAGGYYLYQEQVKFQNEAFAKLSQLEGQLSALDTEADQARQNKQSIDTLNQGLEQFKTDMDTTLKAHQRSLATLDEDVMRLKEKVNAPGEVTATSPSVADEINTGTEAPIPGELFTENPDEVPLEDTESEKDPDHESQKFVEWMENFFSAIWNWFAGLFS